jgi:hypothetical protein
MKVETDCEIKWSFRLSETFDTFHTRITTIMASPTKFADCHSSCFKAILSLDWYHYLCNQCLSPLTLWVRIPLGWGVLDTTLCDKVCQWLVTGRWFSLSTTVSSTNKADRHDITEILLKVALNTIDQTHPPFYLHVC